MDYTLKITWFHGPFHTTASTEFTTAKGENLIELSCDNRLKAKLINMELAEFLRLDKNEYPLLSSKAMKILIPFSTSYLCEARFFALAVIKSNFAPE